MNDQEDYLTARALKVVENPLDGFGDVVKSWSILLRIRRDHYSTCAMVVEAFLGRRLHHWGIVTDCGKKTFDHIQLAYHHEKYFVRGVSEGAKVNPE